MDTSSQMSGAPGQETRPAEACSPDELCARVVGAEACSPEELCARIVGAVRAAAKVERSLRRVWAYLARDLLALFCGIRPAVMLDYVSVAPGAILSLLDALCSGPAGDAHVHLHCKYPRDVPSYWRVQGFEFGFGSSSC